MPVSWRTHHGYQTTERESLMSQDEIIQGIREEFNSPEWTVTRITGPARQLLLTIAPALRERALSYRAEPRGQRPCGADGSQVLHVRPRYASHAHRGRFRPASGRSGSGRGNHCARIRVGVWTENVEHCGMELRMLVADVSEVRSNTLPVFL